MTSCYCNTCAKSKHNKSKNQKHKKNLRVFFKEYEFIRPDINDIDSIIDNCATSCYKKTHTYF